MSVHVLIQNQLCIEDYAEKLIAAYPSSAVIVSNYIPSVPKSAPVLADKWLVIVYLSAAYKKQVQASLAHSESASLVFVTSLRNKEVQALLSESGVEYSVRDTTEVSLIRMKEYVSENLRIGDSLAKLIVDKSNRYEPMVVKNVATLSILPSKELSTKSINLYLPGKSSVSFRYLYRFIVLGVGEYPKVVQLVHRYQHSVGTLTKFLVSQLTLDIELFEKIMDAELTAESYVDIAESMKKPVHVLSEALQLFNTVPYERLISLKLLFETLPKPNPTEFLYKLRGVLL